MEWADYYDRFYDWADSTQISRLSGLTDFGSDCSAEVLEIAQCFVDDKVSMRLINKAIAGGVRFSVDEVMELTSMVDKPILTRLVDTATGPFSKEQLEELYMLIDDEVFERVSKRSKVDIFADDSEEDDDTFIEEAAEPNLGFFTKLGLAIGVASALGNGKKGARFSPPLVFAFIETKSLRIEWYGGFSKGRYIIAFQMLLFLRAVYWKHRSYRNQRLSKHGYKGALSYCCYSTIPCTDTRLMEGRNRGQLQSQKRSS